MAQQDLEKLKSAQTALMLAIPVTAALGIGKTTGVFAIGHFPYWFEFVLCGFCVVSAIVNGGKIKVLEDSARRRDADGPRES